MQSPLTNLSNVLRIVRESAGSYETTLKKNEAAARAVLIDPILRALGWDVANPFMVEVETVGQFGANKVSADYALKADGEVVVVVEAKKLGTDLKQFHHQLVQYGFSFGIERLFLTDGIRWEHFTSLSPSGLAPTRVLDLHADDLGQVAAYLVRELDAALVSPGEEQIDKLTEEIQQLQEEVSKLKSLEKRIANLEGSAAHSPPPQPESDPHWQSLEGLFGLKGKKPITFRLPSGEEVAVRNWAQVLVESCRFALTAHPTLEVPLADKAGKKTTLIQPTKFPSNVGSRQIEINGQVLYVYVNYSADKSAENAAYVLELVPDHLKKTQAAVYIP